MALGMHNRLFFEKICQMVQGAEYILYFVKDQLAAFNLIVVRQDALVDEYFCMDYEIGRQYNLYFLSWLDNIRYCIDHQIPVYHVGHGAQETKVHLGATLTPSFVLFKHRRPLFDRFLFGQPAVVERIFSYLGFWPAIAPPRNLGRAGP